MGNLSGKFRISWNGNLFVRFKLIFIIYLVFNGYLCWIIFCDYFDNLVVVMNINIFMVFWFYLILDMLVIEYVCWNKWYFNEFKVII